jgi:hypothetical protein
LLPVSISLGQDEAKAYVTYRRARVTTRRVYRRAYRRLLLPLLRGERGDMVNYCFPKTWQADRELRAAR